MPFSCFRMRTFLKGSITINKRNSKIASKLKKKMLYVKVLHLPFLWRINIPSCLAQHTCILGMCVYVSVLKNSRTLKRKPRCFFSHVRHAVLDCEAEREVAFICFTILYFLVLWVCFVCFFFLAVHYCLMSVGVPLWYKASKETTVQW